MSKKFLQEGQEIRMFYFSNQNPPELLALL